MTEKTKHLPIRHRERVFTVYKSNGAYAAMGRRFQHLLQRYDRNLVVRWLWDRKRWSVWTRDRRGFAYLVYVAETPTGGYREIGHQDVRILAGMDQARRRRGDTLLAEVDKHNDELEQKKKRKMSGDIKDLVRDRWRWLKGNPIIPVGIQV